MNLKDSIFKTLLRNGYSQYKDGRKVWDVANRSFLYMNPKLAKAFLEVKGHPGYKKTVVDAEIELLKQHSKEFVSEINEPFNLIDMGCGDGIKAKTFLSSIGETHQMRFCPVNISKNLVTLALKNIKKEKFKTIQEYEPHVVCLDDLHHVSTMVKNSRYQKNVILLLGSILASFEPHEYLFNLTRSMFRGDRLIIGNGIRTGERFANLQTYTHPLFQQWLIHVIKELGFKENEIEYEARFANGRVEGLYKILVDKKLSHKGKTVEFKKEDEVIIAVLYKYFEKELENFCRMYFRDVELVKDKNNEYALVLCKK